MSTSPKREAVLRTLTTIAATLTLAALPAPALASSQPARIAAISRAVFGPNAPVAECVAHYESTDGAHLYNGVNLGPWQINVAAHPWVDRRRVVTDWWYAARVAYRISSRGRDWSPWSTHRDCGV